MGKEKAPAIKEIPFLEDKLTAIADLLVHSCARDWQISRPKLREVPPRITTVHSNYSRAYRRHPVNRRSRRNVRSMKSLWTGLGKRPRRQLR
jgi:hypothetical protein